MSLRFVGTGISLFLIVLLIYLQWSAVFAWAIEQQRIFQNLMASSLRLAQQGDLRAVFALCFATFSYGFVHALGPGHGKILLGGSSIASNATYRKMVTLSVLSALMQSLTAILLIWVFAGLLSILTTKSSVEVTEDWLQPASYIMFALIGCVLIWRGVSMFFSQKHIGACHQGCSHNHGPSADQVEAIHNWRDSAVLVTSIAMRPCTGALFLLVIAQNLDLFWLGALATFTMGLGTAVFNSIVAASGVWVRRLVTSNVLGSIQNFGSVLYVIGGGLVIFASVSMLLVVLP